MLSDYEENIIIGGKKIYMEELMTGFLDSFIVTDDNADDRRRRTGRRN